MPASENQQLHLRVDVLDPPRLSPDDHVAFGLQDKNGSLTPGIPQPDGSLRFECVVQVRLGGAQPNFLGTFAHGTPQDRFLYLTWQNRASQQIIQRIKIKLASITLAQVEAALGGKGGKHLHVSISAARTGSVPLLGAHGQRASARRRLATHRLTPESKNPPFQRVSRLSVEVATSAGRVCNAPCLRSKTCSCKRAGFRVWSSAFSLLTGQRTASKLVHPRMLIIIRPAHKNNL